MNYFSEIVHILSEAKAFGEKISDNGTQLIGHVPHVAPEAWFHQLFPPLTLSEVKDIEKSIGNELPAQFIEFFFNTNGIKIFSGALSIYGLRRNYIRTVEASRQPFSIATPNVIERLEDAQDSYIFIGGYPWMYGSYLYIDTANNDHVYRCSRKSAEPLNEWSSFWEMLLSETKRLSKLFDETGKKINKDQPTVPEPQ